MKQLVCNLLAVLAFQAASAQSYTITGKVEGAKNDSVHLFVLKDRKSYDTFHTVAANGRFTFKGTVKNAPQNAAVFIGPLKSRKSSNFYLEPGKISMTGHIDTLDYLRVYGTYNNDLNTANRLKESKQYAAMNAFRAQKDTAAAEKMYNEIWSAKRDFVRQHPQSMAALMNVWVLQSRVPLDTAKSLYALLAPALKQTEYGQMIGERLDILENVRIGKTAPNFDAKDVKGNKISLASFRGKYVLLDFWASWCVPCRAENPHVVAAHKQFKEKGFEVISVSLDKDREKWVEAIEKDQLDWHHISELNFVEEPIAKQYGVQAIPDNFLIDPNGKIVAMKLRGEELQKTLTQFIK